MLDWQLCQICYPLEIKLLLLLLLIPSGRVEKNAGVIKSMPLAFTVIFRNNPAYSGISEK